jgi:hypothetical protein
MSCKEWEEAIAVLVDGETAVRGLAEHLEECEVCSQLLQNLRADQAALRAMPEVDSAAREALRNDVLRQVGRPSRTARRWYAAAASIAAALTIVSILVRMPGRPAAPMPGKPEPAVVTRVPKRVDSAPRQVAMATRKPPKKRVRAATAADLSMDSEWGRILSASPQIDKRPAARGSTSEIAMRIQTSDPDVVILWLKEEVKGDSNE